MKLAKAVTYREFKVLRPREYAPSIMVPKVRVTKKTVTYIKKVPGYAVGLPLPIRKRFFSSDMAAIKATVSGLKKDVPNGRWGYRIEKVGKKRVFNEKRERVVAFATIMSLPRRVRVTTPRIKVRVRMKRLRFKLSYSFYRRLYKMARLQQVNARRLLISLYRKKSNLEFRWGDYVSDTVSGVPRVLPILLRSTVPSSGLIWLETGDDYDENCEKIDSDQVSLLTEVETFPHIIPYTSHVSNTYKLAGKRSAISNPVLASPYPGDVGAVSDSMSRPMLQTSFSETILGALSYGNRDLFKHAQHDTNPYVSGWGGLVNKLNAYAATSSVNLGVTAGEYRESINMLCLSVKKFASAFASAKKGNFYQAALTLTGKGSIDGKIASNWLELQYGWLPLMSEIKGYYDFIINEAVHVQKIKASQTFNFTRQDLPIRADDSKLDSPEAWHVLQQSVSYDGDAVYGSTVDERCSSISPDYLGKLRAKYPLTSTTRWFGFDLSSSIVGVKDMPVSAVSDITLDYIRVKTHVNVSCILDSPFDNFDRLGLGDVYSVAWELVPFSFVADWFLPIGDLLTVLTTNKRILSKVSSLNLTVTHKLYVRGISTSRALYPRAEIYSVESTRKVVPVSDVKENLSVPFDPSFSLTKALNALALIKQVILK